MTQQAARDIDDPAYIAELGYRCYGCMTAEGLYWYRGTSMPLCRSAACREVADEGWMAGGGSPDFEWTGE